MEEDLNATTRKGAQWLLGEEFPPLQLCASTSGSAIEEESHHARFSLDIGKDQGCPAQKRLVNTPILNDTCINLE
eukprot:c51830_g1_i1 orf=91-315(+)